MILDSFRLTPADCVIPIASMTLIPIGTATITTKGPSMIAQAFKSRTIWFAIALAVLSVLQGFVLQLPIPPWGHAIVGSVVAAAIVVLRAITTQPLTEK